MEETQSTLQFKEQWEGFLDALRAAQEKIHADSCNSSECVEECHRLQAAINGMERVTARHGRWSEDYVSDEGSKDLICWHDLPCLLMACHKTCHHVMVLTFPRIEPQADERN